jgi:hypothetical protein
MKNLKCDGFFSQNTAFAEPSVEASESVNVLDCAGRRTPFFGEFFGKKKRAKYTVRPFQCDLIFFI